MDAGADGALAGRARSAGGRTVRALGRGIGGQSRRGLLKRTLEALVLVLALLAPAPVSADKWWAEATPRAISAADAVSDERVFANAEALGVTIGSRPAWDDSFKAAADYAQGQLARLGYAAHQQDFAFTMDVDRSPGLKLDAEDRWIGGSVIFGAGDGDVSGELVEVGLGRPEDLGDRRLDGRIALAKRGEITFQAKAQNARDRGAVGLVVYNNVRGQLNGATLGARMDFPVYGVSDADGAGLLDALAKGNARARLVVRHQTFERHSSNVIGDGGDPAAPGRVVVGAHLDSVEAGPGANDNGSGSAAVLELARVFATRPEHDRLTFVLFGAEEEGLIGSHNYVQALGAAKPKAMVNLDMVAVGDRFEIGAGNAAARDLARRGAAAAAALGYRASAIDMFGGSDHQSFAAAGIPSVMLHWSDDPNYHQPTDRVPFLDREKLAASTRTAAKLIGELLAS